MSCFIIAEAGVNHNGCIQLAKELVYAAYETGADAIKFQTFNADMLVNKTAEMAQYQKMNTSKSATQYEMLRSLELSEEEHYILIELANSLGIEFMSTGFDEKTVDFLVDLGVKRLKVPSGEVVNMSYLRHVAQKKLPIILSTGMCDIIEVGKAVETIRPFFGKKLKDNLILLHCTSNYPTAFSDVNLRAMQTLASNFGLAIGYSDHTLGALVPIIAVGMGACVIEKHFTLNKNLPGPDHVASMTPDEMQQLVKSIKSVELALGHGIKTPSDSEIKVRELVRKSVTLKRDLTKGSYISEDDLILLRPGHGICPAELPKVIGVKIKMNLPAGTTLLWEHCEIPSC